MKKFILDKLETREAIYEYGKCIIDKTEDLSVYLPNLPSIYQEGIQAICLALAIS